MPPPAPNRLLIRTQYAWDLSGSAGIPSPLSQTPFNNFGQVDPATALNSPGMDIPYLYHTGTAFAMGPGPIQEVAPPTSDAGFSAPVSAYFYRPASPPRQFGAPGFMPRVPKTVVMSGDLNCQYLFANPSSLDGFFATLGPILDAAGAGLMWSGTAWDFPFPRLSGGNLPNAPGFSPVSAWAPFFMDRAPPILNANGFVTFVPGIQTNTPIPMSTWLGGEILYIPVSAQPYFGHIVFCDVNDQAGYVNSNFNVRQVRAPSGGDFGEYICFDQPMANLIYVATDNLYARCSRFSANFLYDPVGPPTYAAALGVLAGNVPFSYLVTGLGLRNFSSTSVPGLYNATLSYPPTNGLDLVTPNIVALIKSFWNV